MPTFVRTQEINHTIGRAGRLELRVRSADVQVRATEGTDVRVRGTFEIRAPNEDEANRIYDEIQLREERTSDSLRLTEPDDRPGFAGTLNRIFGGGDHGGLDLEVELPAGSELRLDTVSGDVKATGLRGAQRYHTVSGDLYLTEMGGSVRVNTVSGDATVRGVEPMDLRAEAISGDLRLSAPLIRGLRSTSVSGDIGIEGELSPSGEFRAETVSGDLSIGLIGSAVFEVRGLSTDISSNIDHRVEGRLDRRRVVIGSGGPQFIFNSMSGDLSIRRPRRVTAWAGPSEEPVTPVASSSEDQLKVLRALEAGEIDVEEAMRRMSGGSSDA
jgi:Toastrack DUF4097